MLTSLILIASFVVSLLVSPLVSGSIALPIVVDDQGFNVTITYYYVSGPNTIVLIGSVKSPQSLVLTSLTGLASINGVAVGSGSIDEKDVQLTGGIAMPVSATVTTYFNIYTALWLGEISVSGGARIPFHYDSTLITVVLSGQVCVTPQGNGCVPWPSLNQTNTLATL